MEHVRGRLVLLLGVLTLTSCFDQVLTSDVESDGRLTITNDEAALSERLSYVEVDVPIDPLSPAPVGRVASPAPGARAVTAPTRSSVRLTLVAELASPTVDGEVVQATAISPHRTNATQLA